MCSFVKSGCLKGLKQLTIAAYYNFVSIFDGRAGVGGHVVSFDISCHTFRSAIKPKLGLGLNFNQAFEYKKYLLILATHTCTYECIYLYSMYMYQTT